MKKYYIDPHNVNLARRKVSIYQMKYDITPMEFLVGYVNTHSEKINNLEIPPSLGNSIRVAYLKLQFNLRAAATNFYPPEYLLTYTSVEHAREQKKGS